MMVTKDFKLCRGTRHKVSCAKWTNTRGEQRVRGNLDPVWYHVLGTVKARVIPFFLSFRYQKAVLPGLLKRSFSTLQVPSSLFHYQPVLVTRSVNSFTLFRRELNFILPGSSINYFPKHIELFWLWKVDQPQSWVRLDCKDDI